MSAASIVTTLMRQVEDLRSENLWLRDWLRFVLVTYGPDCLFSVLDGEEILDARKVLHRQLFNVAPRLRCAVAIQWEDADPQRLLPALGRHAIEPRLQRHGREHQEQEPNANGFPHA